MLQGLLILIWISCKRNVSITIGVSIGTEACQILGKTSQNSLYWKKSLPQDICGPVRDWPKFTTRPDHVWPEVWTKIGKAAQNPEKQERKNEMRKLNNARRLRGIYFVDLDDQDNKETLKHGRRNFEKTCGTSFALQKESSKEHHESDCRAWSCIPKDSKDTI